MKLDLNDFARKLTENRGKKKELSPFARAAICALVAAGQSQRAVARLFGVQRDAIARCIAHWLLYHTFESRPRKGRPEVLTKAEKRYIISLIKRRRDLAKKALISSIGKKVSYSTIRRVLRENNLKKWKAMKRIPLTSAVAKDRLDFAIDWLDKIEELLRVSTLDLCRFSSRSDRSRLCSQMSAPAKTTLLLRLPGTSDFPLRSGIRTSSTSGTMGRPVSPSWFGE